MKKYILFIALIAIILLPIISFAQFTPMQPIPPTAVQIPTNAVDPNITTRNTSTYSVFCSLPSKAMLGDLFDYATCVISRSIIPLIFALAIAMFVWGVVQYVINAQAEAKRQKGRDFMIWGIIALAVMVSVWGLVGILRNTFGIQANVIPSVQTNK